MNPTQTAHIRTERRTAALHRINRSAEQITRADVLAEVIEGDHAEALDDPRQRIPHACLTDEQWATARARGLM